MNMFTSLVSEMSSYDEAKQQKKQEWMLQRRSFFSASEFYKLMTSLDKLDVLPKGAETYVYEKVAETLTDGTKSSGGFVNKAMQWGIDHEHRAVDEFIKRTGYDVQQCKDNQKFMKINEHVGGTPDGIIVLESGELTGIEIKCPESHNHLFNLHNVKCSETLAKHHAAYYWQVQGLMMITGADFWHFISFDPRYINPSHQMHIVTIQRHDDDIAKLSTRLNMAIALKVEVLRSLND